MAEVRVLAGHQIYNYGTVSLTFAESFNSFFQQCTFNREFLAAFPITTSFASSIVSTKIFIRCCFTLSAGIAWKNLFVIWKKGAKLRRNVWNKTKASGSQHTRFNSIYLNLTGVSKNGRTCPKSDKSPKIEWNRPKSNGTVRKQAKMSDTRRNLPIPDGSFWNGMWNEMWKVFETRRETLKIGRNYSKLHGSVRNRLFLSCLEGKKNHSSCYQGFWWIRCDKTLLIYCFQTGRKDSFYGTYLANHSQHWCWMSRADRRSQVEHPQHLFPTFGFLLQQCSSVRGVLL